MKTNRALAVAVMAFAALGCRDLLAQQAPRSVRVVVWDERQPRQKRAYANFLGNQIADYLRSRPGLTVKSVSLGDPQQGQGLHGAAVVLVEHEPRVDAADEERLRIVPRVLVGPLGLHDAVEALP